MRVLYDSNIFISYLLSPNGKTISKLFDRNILLNTTLLLPEPLITEFATRIKTKPFLSDKISHTQLKKFIETLSQLGEIVRTIKHPIPKISRDPKDDFLFAYAIVGKADYLVSGDKDLLVLKKIDNTMILNPRDFINLNF